MFGKRVLLLITGLALCNGLFSQLCEGSLGDAVINTTFGAGSNPGPALPAATTNLQYVTNACPVNGYYAVLNKGTDCNGYSWHTLPSDHTGDANGYFMLIDASFQPSDFYLDTVKGLCANTTYEFAAWILNMKNIQFGIRPTITFNIETTTGTILQSYNTGDVPPEPVAKWRQYGFYFTTTAAANDIVLRMTNKASGGDGNDLALDDITFRPCGPKISVSINGSLSKKIICTSDTAAIVLSSVIAGYTNPFYQWQQSTDSIIWTNITGANSPSYVRPPIALPGTYFFRVAVARGENIAVSSCRIPSDPVTLIVESLPLPQALNNSPACEGTNITLAAAGGSSYAWLGPDNYISNLQSPVITNVSAANGGKYYVKVTSSGGCTNEDSTVVSVHQNPSVNAGGDVSICHGSKTQLQASYANGVSFFWTPQQGLSDPLSLIPLASPEKTTIYTLTVADALCKNADSVLINVLMKPTADAGPDKAIISNQVVTLQGKATGSNISYYWKPDLFIFPDSVLNPQVSPPYDTAYTLYVISNDGCGQATDKVLVRYYKEIYIPNGFTPNNDGLNDRWNIPALAAFPAAEVNVYNRFGQAIFYNKGYTSQWNGAFKGALQPAGVYCYLVNFNNGTKPLSGFVLLSR